jgi:hypothetical protein
MGIGSSCSCLAAFQIRNAHNVKIGQLVDKKLHSTDGNSFKQSIDYRYNIRGWLNSVNNSQLIANSDNDDSDSDRDLFGMELAYEKTITGINNDPLYNGNIGAIKWSNNLALGTTKDVAYKYGYDTLNRLKSAVYLTNPGAWTSSTNFAESGFKYDLNGNILALQRTDANGTTMDQLKYTYDPVRGGNQLKAVTDDGATSGFKDGNKTGDDYTYDVNGNMKVDKNKSIIAITYNEQNLPLVVTKSTGENIKYIYDATGRKVSQLVYNASGTLTKKTDYMGEFIYQNDTLQFINHEEGRVVMNQPALQSGGTTEYQYHLKDHLGNVRMTFTAQPVTEQPVATFETVNAVTEQGKFLRMDDARLVNSRMFDHTYTGQTPPGDGSAYSERLSGSVNEKTGIARSISVMPGDIIRMEVFVKYVDRSNTSNTADLTQLLGQIANNSAAAGVVIDGANYLTNGSSLFPYTGLAGEGSSTGLGPKAYLNYIMFDRNYVPVLNDVSQTNFVRVSTDAKEDGTTNLPYGKAHEKLYAEVVVKQPGYMYIYLSNEETTPVDVFFDDFKVTQVKSPVVQMEDFYPFGLKFNSYARENAEPNTLKLFQGQEHIDDLGLNWDAFKWRNHQPDIGRFFNIDPLADKYVYNSTYAFSENQVVAHRELEGLEKVLAVFYHGGPTGGGNTTTPEKAGTTGDIYKSTQATAVKEGREFAGTVIAPGFTSASGVKTGQEFVNANYKEGDQVVIYGYSYGVDNAMDLATNLGKQGITVNTLVTVDGSDGPLQNSTVNTTVPDNVLNNLNIYQTNDSGSSSSSAKACSNCSRSDSGSSNSPGSNGGPNKTAPGNPNTPVDNRNVTAPGVTHGNIQQKQQPAIQSHIQDRIHNYYIPVKQ